MAARRHLVAGLLLVLAGVGCGGDGAAQEQVRLLAPGGIVEDVTRFERETDCRVDLRVYDEDEDVDAIARRRDVDVVAGPVPPGGVPHITEDLVRITVAKGLEVTVPKRLAPAFEAPGRPAGRRSLAWSIRAEGENEVCARRWIAYATSQ